MMNCIKKGIEQKSEYRAIMPVISRVIALYLLLAVFVMAGCSSKDNQSNDNPSNDNPSGGTAEALTETPASNDDTTIVEQSPTTYVMTAENVKIVGRTSLIDDRLWCALSGSGVEFMYHGSHLEITLRADGAILSAGNHARVGIFVNGERVVDEMIDALETTYTVYDGAEADIEVKVVKLTEAPYSTFGIAPITVAAGESIAPTKTRDLKIEFIGDSITCGYGVDDEDKEHHFDTKTEDVTKAYAYKTAQLLGADYSIVSYSGYGIVSGYTSDSNKKSDSQLVPLIYDKVGYSSQRFSGKTIPQELDWDFSQFVPDVVVVNLGTNDASYCTTAEKKQEYVDGYVAFLKQLRKYNPDAKLVCALGVMGDTMFTSIQKAVEEYSSETGDTEVYALRLSVQDAALGYAADWHPTEANHARAAEETAEFIRGILK